MPTLTILVGLPASGKSTWRAENTAENTHIFSTDDIIERVAKNEKSTYSGVFKKTIGTANKIAARELADAFRDGRDVVIDRTNMTPGARRKYVQAAPKNYKINCVCWLPPATVDDWKELWARLSSREGKEIPENVIKKMHADFVWPDRSEGFDNILYLNIHGMRI